MPTGIAALAADGTNFYVATYSTVFAYSRASGNQDGQWTMPAVPTANSSNNDLVSLAAAAGSVFVSVTRGNTVSVYKLNPGAAAAPQLLVRGLGDAIGSDGSVYYERTDHRLAALRPNGTTALGPMLADKPNGLGGGVQYIDVVAGGAVWVSEPAGQGLDASYTTYDVATLRTLGSYNGSVTSTVVDSAAGALELAQAGSNPACPAGLPEHPDGVRVPHHAAGCGDRCGRRRRCGHAARPGTGVVVSDTVDEPVRPRPTLLKSRAGTRRSSVPVSVLHLACADRDPVLTLTLC